MIMMMVCCLTGCGKSQAGKERSANISQLQDGSQGDDKDDEKVNDKDDDAANGMTDEAEGASDAEKADNGKAASDQESGDETNVGAKEGGKLHVEGTALVNESGKPVQLRGVSTHGLAWFPQYVNQEFFTQLHEQWHANVVRLAMYTDESGGYCSDGDKSKLKQLVKDGVSYAEKADLYVIIDWHILHDNNPQQNKEEAKKFFDEMSKEYAGDNHVLYEICNEPNGNTSWEDVKSYAEEIIPVIRANDKDGIIIVGTPTWSQDVDQAAADPIEGYDNIMYALHFYAATHTDWLRDRMAKALADGLPIFVTEFGTCDASGNGGMDMEQTEAWKQAMDAAGVSYVAWNLSNKNETSAIFKPECTKTAGFTEDDLTENGKWIYHMLSAGSESTEKDNADAGKTENKTGESTGKDNADAGENQSNKSDSSTQAGKKGAITGTDDAGALRYSADIVNSWESEGKTFYQYALTLENVSDKETDGWQITVTFDSSISFSDGWNGDYKADGKELNITAKDYNAKIAPGAKSTDIGFIISK